MKGFDAEFRDLDHYIRVITERIWEGRRIDDIHRYYSDPCIVETPGAVTNAVQDVIQGTEATLAQFPDRRLLAEDVIKSGDEAGGWLSSHRVISTMTHSGDGVFGPASGKRIHVRTIADCVCKNNQIVHEWLIRDQGAIARQIGMAPRELAQRWLDERGWSKALAGAPPAGYRSHLSQEPLAQRYAEAVHDFALAAPSDPVRLGTLTARAYDDAVQHIGPGETTRYGHAEVAQFWRELFAAFKVVDFKVEHLALNRGDDSQQAEHRDRRTHRADRAALRWRAKARHEGEGLFGKASGKPVEIMGICHAEFFRGRVMREWVLIDELALWMQLLDRAASPSGAGH